MGDIGKTIMDVGKGAFDLVTNPVGKIGQMTGDFVGGDVGNVIRQGSSLAGMLSPGGAIGGLGAIGNVISGGNTIGKIGEGAQNLGKMLSGADWGGMGKGALDIANSSLGQKGIDYAIGQQKADQTQNAANIAADKKSQSDLDLYAKQQEDLRKQQLSSLLTPSKRTPMSTGTTTPTYQPYAYI